MANTPRYYIVEASALPEVFIKVAETKRILSTGKASTVNDATQMTGISRSAFYKYRDAIMPLQDIRSSRIITFQILLHDEPGALNQLLTIFASHQANIMTINSTIPSNGSGAITIAAETVNLEIPLEDLLEEFRQVPGVIRADILAG